MGKIEKTLTHEVKKLKNIISEAEKRLKHAPEGHLRVANKDKKIEYYYKTERDKGKNGKYLKKREIELAKGIAQRDYDVVLLRKALERTYVIEKFLQRYEKTDLKEIYRHMNPYRKELIKAVEITDDDYIQQWQGKQYEGKEIIDEKVFITEKGERVRSKSEKIIADKLYYLGIPYKYECPLFMENNVKIYPDFTILKLPERKEIYLEHLGMMDDMEYMSTTVFKFQTYERNGIYIGVNLFFTFETSKNPLNTRALDDMIKKVLEVD